MTRWWWRWRQWWWKWSGQLLLGSNPRPTHEQPAVACRQCLSRALLRQEVTTSVAQGGVEVLASVVVAIGLEVYDAVAASHSEGQGEGKDGDGCTVVAAWEGYHAVATSRSACRLFTRARAKSRMETVAHI